PCALTPQPSDVDRVEVSRLAPAGGDWPGHLAAPRGCRNHLGKVPSRLLFLTPSLLSAPGTCSHASRLWTAATMRWASQARAARGSGSSCIRTPLLRRALTCATLRRP